MLEKQKGISSARGGQGYIRMVNRYTAWSVVKKFGYIRMVNRYTAWSVINR